MLTYDREPVACEIRHVQVPHVCPIVSDRGAYNVVNQKSGMTTRDRSRSGWKLTKDRTDVVAHSPNLQESIFLRDTSMRQRSLIADLQRQSYKSLCELSVARVYFGQESCTPRRAYYHLDSISSRT